MARIPLRLDEIIDGARLHARLSSIAEGKRPSEKQRAAILKDLKDAIKTGKSRAEALLLEDGSGSACAARISHLMDEVLLALYGFAINHVYPLHNPSKSEHMALVAVGGYGRGTLAPDSDIDLLFLLPYKQTPWGEQIVEYLLYALWDLGLKVGHATRTIDESIRQSESDLTIRTAILEARYILGERELFDELRHRFTKELVMNSGPEFVIAKLEERDRRHRKAGESRYLVEPNVKDGKGGLRDLHTLFWIGKYFYRVESGEQLIAKGVFTRKELNMFRKAEDFLWAVRCHMHFVTGKAEERLHFDLQREIAERLGYVNHPGLSAVERFMKHYFLFAKSVGDLTRIFCSALEEQQDLRESGLSEHAPNGERRRKLPGTDDFIIDNHRLTYADENIFKRDRVNILRAFWYADRHVLGYHPDLMKLLTRSLQLIDKGLRRNEEANRLFLDILTSDRDPELNLRRMNESGVLGRLIPDFGRIVAMMQFNMYHHYTVDEHLLRCVGVLAEIEHGDSEAVLPLSHSIMPGLRDQRELLYVAVLLHDIAKGRPEDHSEAGAKIARRLCPHMGFTIADSELIAWLIQNHLTMSMTAQTRDLNDRKTIEDFAAIVQNVRRLKLLLILTVCDIRGVGPGVWNGWKGQLLRTLYQETELLLTGGFSEESREQRAEIAGHALFNALEGWPDAERQRLVSLHYPNYLLAVDIADQKRHADFVRRSDAEGKKLATMIKTHEWEAVTEITVLTPDHPRLLSIIAGACAAGGTNIVDAQIFTTSDGRALDTILIAREFELDEDEERRARRVCLLMEDVLSGRTTLPEMIAKRAKPKRGQKAFRREPRASLRNALSHRFSVVEVSGLDRPGLLSEITSALSDLSLNIASAHITTFGEKVIDTFYVTDLNGNKITSNYHIEEIQQRLIAVLRGDAKGNGSLRAENGKAIAGK